MQSVMPQRPGYTVAYLSSSKIQGASAKSTRGLMPQRADQLVLSRKGFLGQTQGLFSAPLQTRKDRAGSLPLQAVLNPFAATRNPMSEADFYQLAQDLRPLLQGLPGNAKKETLRQVVKAGSQILAEASQLRARGLNPELVIYQEREPEGSQSKKTHQPVSEKNGKPLHVVQSLGIPHPPHGLMPRLSQKRGLGAAVDDAVACVMLTVIFSMMFSPQVIIGGPILKKAEELEESAQRQRQDARFYLKGFQQDSKSFEQDFEALRFNNAEKQAMAKTARGYGLNVGRNNELRAYVSETLKLMQRVGQAAQGSHQPPLKMGLSFYRDPQPELGDKRVVRDLSHSLHLS